MSDTRHPKHPSSSTTSQRVDAAPKTILQQGFALLASLKLAVALLVALLLGLAVGTILEARAGLDVANRTVYYAKWFFGLQGLFAINVALSLVDLFPWGKKRVGFVLIHASLLLILGGSLVTYLFKQEGNLILWEGQETAVMEDADREGHVRARHPLPFSVRLDDFVLDTYPGTVKPSGYTSMVQVTDLETRQVFSGKIWMNHELRHRGYALFQSSYLQEGGREGSVIAVAKDPGMVPVFAGYVLLVAGMVVVLFQRIAQARLREGLKAGFVVACMLAGGAAQAKVDPDVLRRLPVQHDGRVMPLDTLAREMVWKVTGSRAWRGEDPVTTFAAWNLNPEGTSQAPLLALNSRAFAKAVGHPGATHISYTQVLDSPRALELMREFRQAVEENRPRFGLLKDAEKLHERMLALQSILQQELVRPFPMPGAPNVLWRLPNDFRSEALAGLAQGPRQPGWPSNAAMEREIFYNQLHATRLSWIILVASLGLSIAAWVRKHRLLDMGAFVALVGGFAMMTWGLALRWQVGGRIPAANMYESLLFLAWGVGLFAVVAYVLTRNRVVVVNASAMAALTMVLVDLLPMDPFIHPIVPVLAGTPWLAIHVPIIMVGYAILALGMVVSHMQIVATVLPARPSPLVAQFHELNYWYIFVGSIFLLAGILTGSVWAASSWGRYWGWDPKEVWSLVAFLAYMAILHARIDRLMGAFGVALTSIIAFQTILMTYLGVNFVLGSGLHAYGAGDSPILRWMAIVALAEILFLAWASVKYRKQAKVSETR